MPQPMRPMTTPPAAGRAVAEGTRARFLDYFLILVGVALSLFLAQLSGLQAQPGQLINSGLQAAFIRIFPGLLLLPVGVILLWPIFFILQKILGRKQEMTWGEWLWGLAWLVSLAFSIWICWKSLGTVPEFMNTPGFRNNVMTGYVVYVLTMGGIAALLLLGGLFSRAPAPWTHTCALALLMWPLVPMAAWWVWGLKLE